MSVANASGLTTPFGFVRNAKKETDTTRSRVQERKNALKHATENKLYHPDPQLHQHVPKDNSMLTEDAMFATIIVKSVLMDKDACTVTITRS